MAVKDKTLSTSDLTDDFSSKNTPAIDETSKSLTTTNTASVSGVVVHEADGMTVNEIHGKELKNGKDGEKKSSGRKKASNKKIDREVGTPDTSKNIDFTKGGKTLKTATSKGSLPIISELAELFGDFWPYILGICAVLVISMVLYILQKFAGILKILGQIPLCVGGCLEMKMKFKNQKIFKFLNLKIFCQICSCNGQ
jgi:hypothetical protein